MAMEREDRMPLISIIVPVYKVEFYLRQCVDSILAQSFRDFELILVDDGSPDNCGDICDEYSVKDRRVIVIHQENAGLSGARNAGLKIARGEYIAFCDSDDYLDSHYIEDLLLDMKSEPDMVSSGFTIVDEKGNPIDACTHKNGTIVLDSTKKRVNFIIDRVLSPDIGWEVWTKLFKRDIILWNNICFCETCGFAEDMGFVLEYLLYCGKIVINTSGGYYYRKRVGSIMRNSRQIIRLNAMNEISKTFGERMLTLEHQDQDQFALVHFLIMSTQYFRMIRTNNYALLPVEIDKIEDQRWFRKWTKAAFKARKEFYLHFGKGEGQKAMLLSFFCLHKNWKVHSYVSALFYKYIYCER